MVGNSGDITLQMPSDLRPTKVSALELDIPAQHVDKRRGITRLTVDIPSTSPKVTGKDPIHQHRSRWRTLEFYIYGIVFCIAIPIMLWIPVRLSDKSHPNYQMFKRRLEPGWLFGREIDNSDGQYRSVRNNIPLLTLLVFVFLTSKAVYTRVTSRFRSSQSENKLYLVPFLLLFSIVMLFGLCGTSAFKIFIILTFNYYIGKLSAGSRLGPIFTWLFNISILFANERYSGYHFTMIHPSLQFLDNIQGVYPRWHINFNITMLRLVSFNMDYYWARTRVGTQENGQALDNKQRTTTYHPLEIYSFQNYIAYALYSPLYIGGPIITFNDFMWQLRRPLQLSLRGKVRYLIRFLICLFTMEVIQHFMYVVAIKDTKAWHGDSAAELCMIGFWNLIIVWLKLLIPWRFFRLWALLDGIDPPENMVRCMANNYSALAFWRSWHRSYNLWIIRYIYIPLGGTKNLLFTSVLIFSFVALWHDLSFKLLAWGWLVSLFLVPEIAARYFLPPSKYDSKPWYRHVCAIGAVFNILMMMIANLVGFVIGTDGISYLLDQVFSSWEGIRFLFITCVCLFVASQVMFEYREEEIRKGIYRRC
ncbi:MBOAT, membrane-bound O-acyltransferase family-domain-containing protein [Abortiporus biennis]|nr:MBOAT, membrane-bound O-acyltransferase family-domain-containing protein [Abortiporus biennis]